jgi:unsaturated rhamnogalacturonyl hydrolase
VASKTDIRTSCCKWGRANGWGMLSHIEVLRALHTFPGHPATAQVLADYRARAKALLAVQDPSTGLWRQLVNDSSTYTESSVSAMAATSMADAVVAGWLPAAPYAAAAERAWAGLVATKVMANGTVTGVCMGTGVEPDAAGYAARPTAWQDSPPGGAGAVLKAAAAVAKLRAFLRDRAVL